MRHLLALAFLLVGCVPATSRRPAEELGALVTERAGLSLEASSAGAPAERLTLDAAVRRALADNPAFRGRLAELGIAQADLAQAAVLENPKAHAALRDAGGGRVNREIGVMLNLFDLLALPAKRRLASSRLEQAKLRVGQETLDLAAAVKAAYVGAQAAARRTALEKDAAAGLEAAAVLSERQRRAGNVPQIERDAQQAAYHEARLELARAEAAELASRERLAALLGAQDRAWALEEGPPDPPADEPALAPLEAAALAERWDLAAARREPAVLKDALRVNRLSLLSQVELGIDSEREFDGTTGVGPAVEFPVPLFDRRRAPAARLKAELRQSRATIEGLETQVRLQLRLAHAGLARSRRAVETYKSELLPLRRRIAEETLKRYNYMLAGVYQVLEAKRAELQAESGYIDALEDYWLHRAELERAAGGRLPPPQEKP